LTATAHQINGMGNALLPLGAGTTEVRHRQHRRTRIMMTSPMQQRPSPAKRIVASALLVLTVLTSACATVGGAAIGAGAGAAIGAGTGHGAGRGALIGAGVGGAAGAIYDITR
jgi:uncharacterized protein YcfJ